MYDTILPIHPTTGIRAVYVNRNGRAFYPIAGGAPEGDGDGGDGSGGDGGDNSGDTGGSNGGDTGEGDKGFPANTPVAQMSIEQQAAYHRHQARRHEERNRDWLAAAGGKTPAELKAEREELEELRRKTRSDGENAVADAEKKGREEAAREAGPKAARVAFEFALSHLEDKDRAELIETLDLTKVLTDSGDVDTAKVRSLAAKIAPTDKDQGNRRRDFGAGQRDGGGKSTGVASGRDLFAERRKTKSASSTSS